MSLKNSARLRFEPFTMDHFDNYYRISSNPEVVKYLFKGEIKDRSFHIENLKPRLEFAQKNPGLGIFAVYELDTGAYVGQANINQMDQTDQIHIGFVLDEPFWGKGYATEIGRHLVKYGFEDINLDRVSAICDLENIASEKAILNCGLKYVDNRFHYGEMLKYFELNRKDYELSH